MQQSKQCAECGATFHPTPGRSKAQWAKQEYCSARCANAWRGRHFIAGPDHGHKVRAGWALSPRGKRAARKQRRKAKQRAERQAQQNLRLQLELLPNCCSDCGIPIPKGPRFCIDCALSRKRMQRQQWNAENPDYVRLYKRSYAKLKTSAQGTCTHQQALARYQYYGGCCAYCRAPLGPFNDGPRDWHWDHVIPLSRDGTAWPANLRPSCGDCNRRKSAQGLSTWLKQG